MGNRFDITVVAKNQSEGYFYINMATNEISRIESLISSWNPNSQTSLINKNSGVKAVKVDKELFQLIERSIEISKITDGAFDITYASMDKIWNFNQDTSSLPSEIEINSSISKVGFHNIILDKEASTVFLKIKGMRIGFGAIGKGYAADRAKALLISKGVSSGIINASGDMNTWGKNENGDTWKVAITNPLNKDKVFALLPLNEGAVVTSGNYEKYTIINGEKYSHIINPKTGFPSKGLSSVSVFSPNAELADALATAVFVMGQEIGLDRINQLPKVECIIIDNEGSIFTSKNIKINK